MREIRPGLAVGIPAAGFDGDMDLGDSGGAVEIALVEAALEDSGFPGKGVDPLTILSANRIGTGSLSFFTRIETRRFEGSVGLFLTRSSWSA